MDDRNRWFPEKNTVSGNSCDLNDSDVDFLLEAVHIESMTFFYRVFPIDYVKNITGIN